MKKLSKSLAFTDFQRCRIDFTIKYCRYRDLCPESCGLCPDQDGVPTVTQAPAEETASGSKKCEDKAKNCNELVDFCTQENTIEMMKGQCEKTCNFCTGKNILYKKCYINFV